MINDAETVECIKLNTSTNVRFISPRDKLTDFVGTVDNEINVASKWLFMGNFERLHMKLQYSRVGVPFIVLIYPNRLLFLNNQSFPSFQNEDMRALLRE